MNQRNAYEKLYILPQFRRLSPNLERGRRIHEAAEKWLADHDCQDADETLKPQGADRRLKP